MDEVKKSEALARIREKRVNQDGRTDRKASESLQDKLRSFDRELEEGSGTSSGSGPEGREGIDGPGGDEGIDRRDGGGSGHTDFTPDESDGGIDTDETGIRQTDTGATPVDGKPKPGGLKTTPSAREKKVREEETKRKQAERQKAYRQRVKASKGIEPDDERVQADGPVEVKITPIHPRSLLDAIRGSKADKPIRKAFSEAEARVVRPSLIAALLDYFSYADELLYATVKGHTNPGIWSSIDEEEAGILVDALLARGKRSAAGAAQIQAMVDAHKNLKIGLILAPRFYQTFRFCVDNGGISLK